MIVSRRSLSRIQMVFWLDLTLLFLMCALQAVNFTGLFLHEWLAVATVGLILFHLLLSWTWITASSRRLAASNAGRTRVNYLLNFGLFASAITVVFSGLLISEVVLHAFGIRSAAGDPRWRYIHNRASNFVVLFAGLHLAINWEWSIAAARKCLRIRPS
jgi:predicted ferric reductase